MLRQACQREDVGKTILDNPALGLASMLFENRIEKVGRSVETEAKKNFVGRDGSEKNFVGRDGSEKKFCLVGQFKKKILSCRSIQKKILSCRSIQKKFCRWK